MRKKMKIEFYKHSLGDEEKKSVMETLDSYFLTSGPKTKQFEEEFAYYMKSKFCIGLSSCTQGLFLVLKAMGITAKDKIIVPAMTFIATSNAVLHAGGQVVFCDVDPKTALIDLNKIEDILKKDKDVRGIIPVHLYGQMVDMHSLSQLAEKYSVKIIEDCAHCVEGERDNVKPGQLSYAAVFSFYATKNIACGEGGAVVTNDANLADRLKIIRLHGMSKSAIDRHVHYQHWDMEELGYKANMFDIQAALLLPQMKKIDNQLSIREKLAKKYENAFLTEGIEFPICLPGIRHARHLFTIWVNPTKRDIFLEFIQNKGIGIAVNYRAVHLRSFYRENFGYKKGDFPVAEMIGDRTLTLPLYPKLTDEEVEYIIKQVINANSTLV